MLPLPTVQEEDDGLTVILVASLAGIVLLIVAVMVALMSGKLTSCKLCLEFSFSGSVEVWESQSCSELPPGSVL